MSHVHRISTTSAPKVAQGPATACAAASSMPSKCHRQHSAPSRRQQLSQHAEQQLSSSAHLAAAAERRALTSAPAAGPCGAPALQRQRIYARCSGAARGSTAARSLIRNPLSAQPQPLGTRETASEWRLSETCTSAASSAACGKCAGWVEAAGMATGR